MRIAPVPRRNSSGRKSFDRPTSETRSLSRAIKFRPASSQGSNAAGRHVAINVITSAQKYDAVTGWVGLVVFQFVIRHDDLGSDIDVFTTQRYVGSGVGDDRDIFVTVDFERIRPISIRLATT